MTQDVYSFLLGVAGAVILILFAIIGYFLKIVHNDAKQAVMDAGKNKGSIELIKLQLDSDVKRIEQTTQLELRNLASTVGKLSASVEQLVKIQLEDKRDHHKD
jgi:hypothetical protein